VLVDDNTKYNSCQLVTLSIRQASADVSRFIPTYLCLVMVDGRATTCLENLEMSRILTAVNEMSGILLKVREVSRKNLIREK